jgi:hypothetical protein
MNSNRRTGLLAAGIVVLIVGLLAAGGLWYSAGQRQSDAVRNFARAPVGCVTTLNFEVAGEFLVFVETAGEIGDVTGSCVTPGAFGQLGVPPDLPPVRLVLTEFDGTDVVLDARTGVDYDVDGSVGEVIRAFVVENPGEHFIRVESRNNSGPDAFAVAIGRDPSEGVQSLRFGAIVAGIAGLAVGLASIAASRRRKTPQAAELATPWLGEAPWPTSPPGAAQPPQAPGWAQPVTVPVPPVPLAHPGQAFIPGQPPFATPTAPPTIPSPPPSLGSEPASGQGTGASGDGERSPWAPPD